MIKLKRSPAPQELTPAVVADKVERYKQAEEPVWNEPYIKQSLLGMSQGKCCYCECNVVEECKYVEVEHFHDKKRYPDEVADWDNLLPSCKRCNSHKSGLDTKVEPIVDPSKEDPREHMTLFRCAIFRPKDGKGKTTIEVLSLNDQERLASKRLVISGKLAMKVSDLRDWAKNLKDGTWSGTHYQRKLMNGVTELFQSCGSAATFSAVKATAVLSDPMYDGLKMDMQQLGMWTSEMSMLEQSMLDRRYSET